jgi:hypothetical protein
VNVRTALGRGVGHIEERLEAVEHALESMEFSTFLKGRFYFIEITS